MKREIPIRKIELAIAIDRSIWEVKSEKDRRKTTQFHEI